MKLTISYRLKLETWRVFELRLGSDFHVEGGGQTLSTSVLFYGAYLRGVEDGSSKSSAIPRLMREVLINRAIAKKRIKRGGVQKRLTFDESSIPNESEVFDHTELITNALCVLKAESPRLYRLIELRLHEGRTIREAAESLKISPATAKRDWQFLKAWLKNEIEKKKKELRKAG